MANRGRRSVGWRWSHGDLAESGRPPWPEDAEAAPADRGADAPSPRRVGVTTDRTDHPDNPAGPNQERSATDETQIKHTLKCKESYTPLFLNLCFIGVSSVAQEM